MTAIAIPPELAAQLVEAAKQARAAEQQDRVTRHGQTFGVDALRAQVTRPAPVRPEEGKP